MPYSGIADAELTPEVHVSIDADSVHYVRWRGSVPSFDGLPLSVDVTVPCGAGGAQPTVVMAHGFGDDKTVWQETGKSDSVKSKERPQTNSRWNNIWFASRGYTVVNYTARAAFVTRVAPIHQAPHRPRLRRNAWRMSTGSTSTTSAGRSAMPSG